jgi:hypothetical protein
MSRVWSIVQVIRCDSAAMVPNTGELLPEPAAAAALCSRVTTRFGSQHSARGGLNGAWRVTTSRSASRRPCLAGGMSRSVRRAF